MKYYDLCVKSKELGKIIPFAKKLGFSGLCIVIPFSQIAELKEIKKQINVPNSEKIDIAFGVELEKPEEIKKIYDVRKPFELVFVSGKNPEMCRMALETPEVDGLVNNSGFPLDYKSVKIAKNSGVSVVFCFNELLYIYKESRSELFSIMLKTARIVKKYKAPFIISSGARSLWDLRSPSDLLSFGRLLGFQDEDIKKSMSDWPVTKNRKKLGRGFVMPGVEVE